MTNDTLRKQMGMNPGSGGVDDDDGGLPWLEPAPDPDRGTMTFKSLAIIGTIFLLVFIAFLAIFYNRIAGTGVSGGNAPGGTPTLIAAPIGDFKVTPEEAASGDFNDDQADTGAPQFAQGSEQPVTGAARLEEALREESGAVDLGRQDEDIIGYARPLKTDDTPSAAVESAKEQVEETAKTSVAAASDTSEAVVAAVEEKAAAPSKPEPAVQTAPAGGFLLQLGAFSTRDSALSGWKQYSQTYPGSLAGLAPDLQAFQNGSGKTIYRLRAAALETRAAADERCAALKAAKQACFVVAR
ncbi:MAG: SPOR domain-containing protein [Pseudomonadota bacterium]